MSHPKEVQAIIENAVSEVLEAALPNLRAQIISRAVEGVESLEPALGSLPTDILNAAASSIQEATSQADILRHLLEGAARFCGRAALFVIKGGGMNGWQGTGFQNNDGIKAITLSASTGLADRAIQGRSPVTGAAKEFDGGFVTAVGSPADGKCLVLPLVVKDKVAALIYADGGQLADQVMDASALTMLCRFSAVWLELTALRKAGATSAPEEAQTAMAPAQAGAGAGNGPAATAKVGEEEDLHRKARRFAKLLVDEIKLYNQSKVTQGKQNRDLYDRLREDIEKSRTAYESKFGATPAASANYFTQELIRVLADNDISLMGVNFPH